MKRLLLSLFGLALAVSTFASDPVATQIEQLKPMLRNKRVGLLVNQTAVDGQYTHLVDNLAADKAVKLVALFAPEHGVRGASQAGGGDGDSVDEETSIPIYTLYGPRKAPTSEQLDKLDVIVFDIQDVGARFYTYGWTMTYAMEACAAADKEFIVMDRPNPLGATRIDGAPLKANKGLIGRHWAGTPMSVATQHGLTMGELATLVNEEFMKPKVKLTVIKVPGYVRSMTFKETGYPWVAPSPNMPTLDTVSVYPGMCIFEGTNLSTGRGTTKPFEYTGAPWVDAAAFAKYMNDKNIAGARFRPITFTPTFSQYKDKQCYGVQTHVTDAAVFRPIEVGYELLKGYMELYPDKVTKNNANGDWCGSLFGQPKLFERLQKEDPKALVAEFGTDLEQYKQMRAAHLLYGESK